MLWDYLSGMNALDRRHFLSLLGATGLAAAMPRIGFAAAAVEPFTFLFLTDTHLQPELDAAHGTDMAFKKARGIKADFVIQGGDHVFDSLAVPKARAQVLFDLYGKTEQDLGMKVYHTIGNHDVLGIYTASGMATSDPYYGKKLYEERVGKTYYSFDHKGHHFIVLDSIGITEDRAYEGRIDSAQLAWLETDLKALPVGTPIIVSVHVPLVTAFDSYVAEPKPRAADAPPPHHGGSVANAYEVVNLFAGHNVLGVLQGHTHINERVEYKGVPYITSGAVSGNWWRGTRMGFPEGFTVVTVERGKLATRYETYGFKSVDPQNT
jgi:Icc protein